MRNRLIGLLILVLASPAAFGAIVVDEEFTHLDGPLVGQTPTPGPGTVWVAHSGAGNKAIQVSSGEITLTQSSGSGEDVNTQFAGLGAGGKYYASFDLELPSGQTVNPDGNGLYFAHFATGDTSGFVCRTFVMSPAALGDFGIALDANSSTTPDATWPSDLMFDTVYQIMIAYDFDSGGCELWIDPVVEADPSITDATGTASTAVTRFAFRQASDYTGSQVIDNLVVGTSFAEAVPVELMSFDVE